MVADVKQKPKMDKPKVKDKGGSLPKDAARMLMNEYRQAAGERGQDIRRRPEREAVDTVEGAMRSAGDRGLAAAKKGGRKLVNAGKKRVSYSPPPDKAAQMEKLTEERRAAAAKAAKEKAEHKAKQKSQKQAARKDAIKQRADDRRQKRPAGGKNTPKADTLRNPLKTKDSMRGAVPARGKLQREGLRPKTRMHATQKAKKSVQALRKLRQRAQMTVKQVKKAAKSAGKAAMKVVQAITKAALAMGKMIIMACAASTPLLVILIVIMAIAAIIASPFGLFFSGEDADNKATMQQTVATLSHEYRESIQEIIATNRHNEMHFDFINHGYKRTDNWCDVLAIFAVDTANFGEDGMDVVELDDERLEKLSTVFWDMQAITHDVKNERRYSQTTDSYEDHYVLYIRSECLGAWTMADIYGFDSDQCEVLAEMLNGEYDDYFNEMIGSAGLFASIGNGGSVVGTGSFIWPSAASTYVTSPHGGRNHPITGEWHTHIGIDISAGAGTDVLAADGGTVISTSVDPSYGIHLLVDHGNGYQTLYAHMSSALVGKDDEVEQGQVIGLVGSTGVSTNPHLHFEVRVNGACIDPLQFYSNYTTAW